MAQLDERYRLRYKGRKGRKRLQQILEQIDQMHRDTGNVYDSYEEMRFLEQRMPDPEIWLHFLRVFRDLDRYWQGIESYGFLRLCGKWIRYRRLEEMDLAQMDAMLQALLPDQEMQMLQENAGDSTDQK